MKSKMNAALLGFLATLLVTACSVGISYGLLKGKVSANTDKIDYTLDQFNEINKKLDKLTDCQTEMRGDLEYIRGKVDMIIKEVK